MEEWLAINPTLCHLIFCPRDNGELLSLSLRLVTGVIVPNPWSIRIFFYTFKRCWQFKRDINVWGASDERNTPPLKKKSFYNWLSSINIYFFLLRFIFFLKNSKWAIILASIFHLQFYVLKINCNILIK